MNKNSNSGMLEDLVRSMTQLASVELHAKTALDIANDNLSTVEDDEIQQAILELSQAEEYLSEVTDLRRMAMNILKGYAVTYNPKKWCEVKHLAMASYTAFEVYQAKSTNDNFLYYTKVEKLFIQAVSDWLGLDIPKCSACFSDALKKIEREEDENV